MIFVDVQSTDPYYNLALEEYFFNQTDEDCFLLWQNHNTIVIGKYQNAIEEISAKFVKDNDIRVVRRLSGGGAVYHDMGNYNFTFITKQTEENSFNFEHFTKHIVDVLRKLGVKAEFNSRNDLVIEGRKFSGNSQYIKKDRILHHGTLLFDSDLEVLVNALNVSDAKIKSKAIKSIHERVTNIKEYLPEDFTLQQFKDALKDHITQGSPDVKEYVLTEEDKQAIERLRNEKYATWEWNYGTAPKCNIEKKGKCDSGMVQAMIDVEEGRVKNIKLYGDFFVSGDLAEFEQCFAGKEYREESLREPVKKLSNAIVGMDPEWLLQLLVY